MQKRLSIYFLFHFLLIIILSIILLVDGYIGYKYDKKKVPVIINILKTNIYGNNYVSKYLELTGINTGYGFYGINVSTDKYFEIELYDSSKRIIKTDQYFNFSTMGGYSRFKSYASHLANYISDTKEQMQNDSNSVNRKNVEVREKYINKIFKWLGKNIAANTAGCTSYKTKLMTVVPFDIWKVANTELPRVYVNKEIEFPTK